MIPDDTCRFSSPQRSLVFRALDEAEERTRDYYCIPPFRWEKLRLNALVQISPYSVGLKQFQPA